MKVRTAILKSLYIKNLPHISMTFTCGIQPSKINAVTMVMKVLHNSYNMRIHDLTDMYALALWPVALMLVHTYQSNHSFTYYLHTTTYNMY